MLNTCKGLISNTKLVNTLKEKGLLRIRIQVDVKEVNAKDNPDPLAVSNNSRQWSCHLVYKVVLLNMKTYC